jgi:hypothetical protein
MDPLWLAFQPVIPFFTKDLQLGNDSIVDSPQDGHQDRSIV